VFRVSFWQQANPSAMPPIRPFIICGNVLCNSQRNVQRQHRCITSATLRQQMLSVAIAELKRVKEYFQGTEFIDDNSKTELFNNSPTILETSADVDNFLQKFDTVMFDCDGSCTDPHIQRRMPH
jgi:hypothetical protein